MSAPRGRRARGPPPPREPLQTPHCPRGLFGNTSFVCVPCAGWRKSNFMSHRAKLEEKRKKEEEKRLREEEKVAFSGARSQGGSCLVALRVP